MLALKTFSKFDWMAFGGAERFDDGSEPMIGNIEVEIDGTPWEGVAVLDANGLTIHVAGDDDDLLIVVFPGTYAAKAVFALPAKISKALLVAVSGAKVIAE